MGTPEGMWLRHVRALLVNLIMKSFSTPDGPDAAHLRQWYTNQCVNRPNYERFASRAEYENFDPRVVNLDYINDSLKAWCFHWRIRTGLR